MINMKQTIFLSHLWYFLQKLIFLSGFNCSGKAPGLSIKSPCQLYQRIINYNSEKIY